MKTTGVEAFLETALRDGLIESMSDDADMLLLDPLRACRDLFAQRVCHYDAECVDEPESYAGVIRDHAAVTQGEWLPDPIEIDGEMDGEITIKLNLAGKKVTWRFEQDGSDWISTTFIKKLQQQTSKLLSGQFIQLPTSDQSVAFVYLPRDAAKEFKKLARRALKAVSIDSLVAFFRKGGNYGSHPEFEDLGLSVNQRDSRGDTSLTAAIRADSYLGVMQLLDRECADPTVPDAEGWTPWQLTLTHNHPDVLRQMRKYAWASMPEGAISGGRKGVLAAIVDAAFPPEKVPTPVVESDLPLIVEVVRDLPKDYAMYSPGDAAARLFASAQASPAVKASQAYSLLMDSNGEVARWALYRLRSEVLRNAREEYEQTFLANHIALDDEAFRELMVSFCRLHPESGEREVLVDDALSRLVALTGIDNLPVQDALDQIASELPQEIKNRHPPKEQEHTLEVIDWVLALLEARTPRAVPLYCWVIRHNVWHGKANEKAAEVMTLLKLPL